MVARATKPPISTEKRLELVLEALSSKKAQDIVSIDLRELGYVLCDYFVIATAESDRQGQALIDGILEALKKAEVLPSAHHVEGYEVGRWILLDLGDIVVHVLLPEVRSYYKLEELWGDAKIQTYD